jgi:hypothetical protein
MLILYWGLRKQILCHIHNRHQTGLPKGFREISFPASDYFGTNYEKNETKNDTMFWLSAISCITHKDAGSPEGNAFCKRPFQGKHLN